MFVRLLFFLWHIILFTASGEMCCLYQHIDAKDTSVCPFFVLVSLRIVSKECWSLAYSLRFNTIFCICFFGYCSESDWVVTEISYIEEEMDTSEGWTVVIISVQAELAYIYRD